MLLLLAGAVVSAEAQTADGGFKKAKKPLKAINANGGEPVTAAEAKFMCDRIQGALMKVLKVSKASSSSLKPSSSAVSCAQLVQEFDRIVGLCQANFKYQPFEIKDKSSLAGLTDPASKEKALRLVKMGVVPASSPLLTNKSGHVSPAEFGDALGLLVGRMAELTHVPSSKFTPYLMDPTAPK